MDEVSCRAFGVVFDSLAERDIPFGALVEGLPVTLETLRNGRKRIDWDLFARLCERFETLCGGPLELERIGREHFDTRSFEFMRRVAATFATPRDLYWMGTHWFGRALFSNIQASFSDLGGGRVREVLVIPPPYRDNPQLFHIARGALQSAPSLLGLPNASVELELAPRRATFTVIPPPGRPGIVRQTWQIFRLPAATRQLIEELSSQQTRIAEQAENLERINQMGSELAKHIEMAPLVDALEQLLRSNFSCAASAIWLTPLDGGPDLSIGRTKTHPGSPTSTYRLKTAGREVGRVEVWRAVPLEDEDPGFDLLQELASWIAIALDNARSYAAQRRHNEVLEARVVERTNELMSAKDKLRAAEHQASIGTLAAGIAHEINNPLCSILLGAHEIMACRKDSDDEPVVDHALEAIIVEAERCGQIVTSVMQLSRNEATEKWTTDLNVLARRAVAATAAYARLRDTRIELCLADGACDARVNPIQIEQVIVNLLRNAVEARDGEGRITLESERRGDQVLIRIRDEGRGIPADDLERIFDPFFTTRRLEGGTGLGLSVVHAALAENAGHVEVESRTGSGTCVWFTLPAVTAP